MKGETYKFYLDNGIKCICYQVKDIHSISINVSVKVGSLDEDENHTGLSHFLEHLAFDGTEEFRDWEQLDEFSNSISGSGNAYTSFEVTSYHGSYPYRYYDEALRYYSQLVFHPLHEPAEVEKERTIIIDELKRDEDSVDTKQLEVLVESRFTDKNTPFSRKIIGDVEKLKIYTRDDLRSFYEQNYIPENIQVYIAGNFEIDTLKASLNKYFGTKVGNGSKDTADSVENKKSLIHQYENIYPEYSGMSIDARYKGDVDQMYLTLSFPGLTQKHNAFRERLIAKFANYVTANPQFQKSILWRKLREELGMVYSIYADNISMFSRSLTYIDTSFAITNLEKAMTEIYLGIERMKEKGEGEEIFNMIVKRTIDTEEMRYDNPDQVINWIIKQDREQELHGKSYALEEYLELVKGIQFSEILQYIKDTYDWSKVNIGAVTNIVPEEMTTQLDTLWKKITG
jgi:predicted Zn-dependent peptidase